MNKIKLSINIFCLLFVLQSCGRSRDNDSITTSKTIYLSDEDLMDVVQKQTFKYFWDFAEPNSGLARERYHPDGIYPENDAHIVTMGGSGFGLMSIIVGVERGYISRQEAVARLETAFSFLATAERFHGAWPHWLNGETGKVLNFSDKDSGGDIVETAFLCQGIICVREYFKNGNEQEKQVADLADQLWKGVEWDWYTQGKDVIYWHWSPKHTWEMNFPLEGYNECLIPYILGAASPEHAISPEAYHKGWTRNGTFITNDESYGFKHILKYNTNEEHTGPLFWAHYSYAGLSPKGLKDSYADYWELNRNQSQIHHSYCIDNPKHFANYGDSCWGLTASYTRNEDQSIGYNAHHPGGHDTGIISPTAALSSMPYTPEASLKAMHYFYEQVPGLFGEAGFYDAFAPADNWIAKRYLAIDQGPIIVMIENHRTALLWDLFMNAPEIQTGLKNLGFTSPYIK
ncbi:hypothetical protein AwDysgo_16040 [Bacteroidales bacterium]|nr:hypothetical protein AwDysgo_16040 [Bacteroidales bacterium]